MRFTMWVGIVGRICEPLPRHEGLFRGAISRSSEPCLVARHVYFMEWFRSCWVLDFSHGVGMPRLLPVSERDFLSQIKNHKEFSAKVERFVDRASADALRAQAIEVAVRWAKLGAAHLREAKVAKKHNLTRACYSRSYYACYNYSKCVRYMHAGTVSLHGDDHGKAPDLPEDFPGRERISRIITDLYSCRLRADYDNWASKSDQVYPFNSTVALSQAVEFSGACRNFMKEKYGVLL